MVLKDVELRYRQRYVDLIVNPDVQQTFITRSKNHSIDASLLRFTWISGSGDTDTAFYCRWSAARPFIHITMRLICSFICGLRLSFI